MKIIANNNKQKNKKQKTKQKILIFDYCKDIKEVSCFLKDPNNDECKDDDNDKESDVDAG